MQAKPTRPSRRELIDGISTQPVLLPDPTAATPADDRRRPAAGRAIRLRARCLDPGRAQSWAGHRRPRPLPRQDEHLTIGEHGIIRRGTTQQIRPTLRRAVLDRDDGCVVDGCTSTHRLEVHHITLQSQDGTHHADNPAALLVPPRRCTAEDSSSTLAHRSNAGGSFGPPAGNTPRPGCAGLLAAIG